MRVYPNAPAFPSQGIDNSGDRPIPFLHQGIPIRLAIAAQIMAALVSSLRGSDKLSQTAPEFCLEKADALIAAYNKDAP